MVMRFIKVNGIVFRSNKVSTIAITILMKADVKHTVVVLINRVAEFSRKITTAFSAAEPRESSGCV